MENKFSVSICLITEDLSIKGAFELYHAKKLITHRFIIAATRETARHQLRRHHTRDHATVRTEQNSRMQVR